MSRTGVKTTLKHWLEYLKRDNIGYIFGNIRLVINCNINQRICVRSDEIYYAWGLILDRSYPLPLGIVGEAAGKLADIRVRWCFTYSYIATLQTGINPLSDDVLFTIISNSHTDSIVWIPGNYASAQLVNDAMPFISSITSSCITFRSNKVALAPDTVYVYRIIMMIS